MKKIKFIYIVVFILLFSVAMQAQQTRSVWLNAITGVNSNWILNQNAYGNPEFEYATSFGLTGGLGVTYFKHKHLGLNGSILLTQMGQNYRGEQGGGDADRKVKLTYLEVPLFFMKDIPSALYPTWISYGPHILILANARQEYSREGGRPLPFPEGMIDGNVKERYKPVDFALSVSVNRMYVLDYLRKTMFLFSVNTLVGLTDINSTDWQLPNMHNEYAGSHNFYIGVKAGIMFKVKRVGVKNW